MPITKKMIDLYSRVEKAIREEFADEEFTSRIVVWDDDDFLISFCHVDDEGKCNVISYHELTGKCNFNALTENEYDDLNFNHDNLGGTEVKI